MRLLLAFIFVPLIEIGLFIQVGGMIGMWPTLAVVLITAVFGSFMIRSQGVATFARLQKSISNLNDPTEPLAHGAMIIFAGALLLTPGFFTDAIGLLLLIPGVRSAIYTYVRSRMVVSTFQSNHSEQENPDPNTNHTIIDGEFSEVSESQNRSGWTKD